MKQISLVFALVLLSFGIPYLSHSQFLSASAPEFFSPSIANVTLTPSRTNCHSAGGLTDPNTSEVFDVSINSFEGFNNLFPSITTAGFSWYLKNLTNPAITTGYTTTLPTGVTEMRKMDIGLLQTGSGNVLVVISFMDFSATTPGQYVAIYELDMAGNSASFVSLTQLTTITTTVSETNLDVSDLKYFVVTYEAGLRIYTVAGTVATGTSVTIGNANELLIASQANRPDVAMCNSTASGFNVHYVYRMVSVGLQESIVPFSTVQLQPAATPISITVEHNYPVPINDFPRIDCPDFSLVDKWSYVCMQNNREIGTVGWNGTVFFNYTLNDGSTPPFPIDLTSYKNQYPVVAFDDDNTLIHYSWAVAGNPSWSPYGYTTNQGYVGVMLVNYTNLADFRYWLMENNLDDNAVVSQFPALSGENNTSPELFSTWTFTDAISGDNYIKCKAVPWNNAGFKPTGVQKLDKTAADVRIYPNPTQTSFAIATAPGVDLGKCRLNVTDICGRKIMEAADDFAAVNQLLQRSSKKLYAGMYTIHLQSEKLDDGVSFIVIKK